KTFDRFPLNRRRALTTRSGGDPSRAFQPSVTLKSTSPSIIRPDSSAVERFALPVVADFAAGFDLTAVLVAAFGGRPRRTDLVAAFLAVAVRFGAAGFRVVLVLVDPPFMNCTMSA